MAGRPTIAVIGAGVLGRGLAIASARAGYRTILEDVLPAKLRRAEADLRRELPEWETAGEPRVEFASTVEDAVREADLIIDCVPDELESKLEIFSLLDRMAPPRAVLATPTRTQSIADLAACTYRPERCVALDLTAEQFQPGGQEPVTITHASFTSAGALDLVVGFWRSLGRETELRPDPAEKIQTQPLER